MADYTPKKPLDIQALLGALVSADDSRARLLNSEVVQRAVNNNRRTAKKPKAYVEYVLLAEVRFDTVDRYGHPVMLTVPEGAKLTIWGSLNAWKLESVLKQKTKQQQDAARRGERIFRPPVTDERSKADFSYADGGRTRTLKVLEDGTLRMSSVPASRSYASL